MITEVKYVHLRHSDPRDGKNSCKGGATVAYAVTGDEIVFAVAQCNRTDHFNKAYGRTKSSGRLASDRYRQTIRMNEREFFSQLHNVWDSRGTLHNFTNDKG